jgi:hypothetical protein
VIPVIPETAIRAAVSAAARFGITSTEPAMLADGANIEPPSCWPAGPRGKVR